MIGLETVVKSMNSSCFLDGERAVLGLRYGLMRHEARNVRRVSEW